MNVVASTSTSIATAYIMNRFYTNMKLLSVTVIGHII